MNDHSNDLKKAKTIDAYINMFDLNIANSLAALRTLINKNIPGVLEKISWGMPTFYIDKDIIHFAAHKKHLGIYPGDKAIDYFKNDLEALGFKYSKGAIQIPYDINLPTDLITKITIWCYNDSLVHKK